MEKNIDKLQIKESNRQVLSIEIDTNTISELSSCELIEKELPKFAKNNPDIIASIYNYITPSVDFFEPTLGLFYSSAGSQKLTNFLYKKFNGLQNVRLLKQYFIPSKGNLIYHVENGEAWRRDDMLTFSLITSETD